MIQSRYQRPVLGLLSLILCPVLRFVSPDETGSEDNDGHGPIQQLLVVQHQVQHQAAVLVHICGAEWTILSHPIPQQPQS